MFAVGLILLMMVFLCRWWLWWRRNCKHDCKQTKQFMPNKLTFIDKELIVWNSISFWETGSFERKGGEQNENNNL